MTAPAGPGDDSPLLSHWRALVDRVAPPSACWRLDSSSRTAGSEPDGKPRRFDVQEVFVRADGLRRRRLDLLCAALLRYEGPDGGPDGADGLAGATRPDPVLVVAGPETIRPRTAMVGAGMSATGVLPERPGPAPSAISVLVFRIERHPEAQEIAESAEALGDLLDFDRDRAGSEAVAATLLRRLDILAPAEGVSVALGGEAARPPGRADTGYQLVVGRDAGVSMGGNVEIHGGRVVTVGTDGKSSAWYGADFVLLGHAPTARATDFRLLLQQRRDRAVLYDRPRSRGEKEGFSYRATRARQAARAEQIVRTVRSGAVDTAGVQVWEALGQAGADGPLPESLVERITDIGDYWRIDDALARGARHGGDRARRALGRHVRLRVGEALDRMLGLPLPPTAEFLGTDDVYAPTVPALRFELASSLVPIVDSTQDSGRFLYELIPDMRDRILADTGVTGPPVRAREDPDLPPGGFATEVEGVPRSTGATLVDARYEVLPAGPGAREVGWPGKGWTAGAVLTPVHPRRGGRGLWRLVPVPPGRPPDDVQLSAAEYMVHHIELVIRAHLHLFVGPHVVGDLVRTWSEDDPELVRTAVPDSGAVLALTWVLQDLLRDGIPLTERRSILAAFRDAGGAAAPTSAAVRAARAALRGRLPGTEPGRPTVRVPAGICSAMPVDAASGVDGWLAARAAVDAWVGDMLTQQGPTVRVVAADHAVRELIAPVVRSRDPFVVTLTEEEVTEP